MAELKNKEDIFLKAKSDALRFLATRGRSAELLRKKLSDNGYKAAIVCRTIDDFKAKGLVVDEKFVEPKKDDEKSTALELAGPRFRRMKGLPRGKQKARIYGFLKRRGFSAETTFQVMDTLFKGVSDDELG